MSAPPLPGVLAAPPTGALQRRHIDPGLVTLTLCLLFGMQPLVSDFYLPTMPEVAAALRASPHALQQTMASLQLAFGVGLLVWGPVADRFGRRLVLRSGLVLFALASLGAAAAPDITVLVAMRIVQGAGMASAVVCARAMLRDLYEPHEGTHLMARALTALGTLGVVTPIVGGLLGTYVGWRGNFAGMALYAGVLVAYLWRHVPETLPERNPDALRPAAMVASWGRILRHPVFLAYTGVNAVSYGGMFVFLSASTLVYIGVLGLSPSTAGLALAANAVAFIAGTLLCRRWLVHHGIKTAVRRGAWLSLVGGLSMAGLAAAGVQTVWAILLPQCLYGMAHGIHQPCGQAGAVGPFPREAGTAAALGGFIQALIAFAIGAWLGAALDGTTRPLAYGIGAWSVATAIVAWTVVQRVPMPGRAD